MDSLLHQALTNIICNWEYQMETCDNLFPTSRDYTIVYSKLTGLRQALDELEFAGLVTYENGRWKVKDNI